MSLQEQVNGLFSEVSYLRAQLGQTPLPVQQPQPPPPPLQSHPQSQPQQNAAIDPSLQSGFGTSRSQFPSHGPLPHESPSASRPKSGSQNQTSFRGPTSAEFSFGVAKSSLQTMGITSSNEQSGDGNSMIGVDAIDGSPAASPPPPPAGQILDSWHADKDPIWKISQDEAMRLCDVYEDELGLMYPVLDISKIRSYAIKLYRFMEAAHRVGMVQQGLPGTDSIDDADTNLLKLVLATAMVVEGAGRSELGARMFNFVSPTIDNMLLGNAGVEGIRLLTMAAMYEFHHDNEGTSWRIIGLTARLCIELGLHRHETYDAILDDSERSETMLLFWSIYVLDRRWSFGTGMPFALQDSDIDANMPKPEHHSPYLGAMIQYSVIGAKVWKSVAATPSGGPTSDEDMRYLDYQVVTWHRNIPAEFRFEHPSQSPSAKTVGPTPSRAGHRLRILLYLRANHMRILIYRAVLHSATSIMQHKELAQIVVDVAKDTIRVLAHINQTSDLYRSQQMLFNAFLTSALAVLFLAVSHTPAMFVENVREEFYVALDLVRGFSKDSWIGKRLWKTIRVLKEVGPRLGLKDSGPAPQRRPNARQKDDLDPNRSAAVAMAGLAGHNVDELALYDGSNPWSAGITSSTSPETMADDLTSLFEAAGGLQAMNNGITSGRDANSDATSLQREEATENSRGIFGSDEELTHILKELF
nr:putative transcriptional regulatory protein [Quercus suber]